MQELNVGGARLQIGVSLGMIIDKIRPPLCGRIVGFRQLRFAHNAACSNAAVTKVETDSLFPLGRVPSCYTYVLFTHTCCYLRAYQQRVTWPDSLIMTKKRVKMTHHVPCSIYFLVFSISYSRNLSGFAQAICQCRTAPVGRTWQRGRSTRYQSRYHSPLTHLF